MQCREDFGNLQVIMKVKFYNLEADQMPACFGSNILLSKGNEQ